MIFTNVSKKFKLWGLIIITTLTLASLAAGATLGSSQYRELFGPPLPTWEQHHDFMAYYSAGVLTSQGHIGQIYQAAPLITIQRHIIPEPVGAAGYMPFLNPPPVALFMVVFSSLTEPAARIIWWSLNLAVILTVAWAITKTLSLTKRLIALAALTLSLPVYQTLIEGQLSILILAGSIAALGLTRAKHSAAASICLSILWLKPQLAVMVLAVLLLSRAWKPTLIFLATPAAILLVLLPFTGLSVHLTYLSFLVGVLASHFNGAGAITSSVWQGSLGMTQGLNGFFVSILGQSNLTVVNISTFLAIFTLVAPFLYLILRSVRPGLHTSSGILMLAATGSLILLVDPHLYLQDVVLLFAVLPLLRTKHRFSLMIAGVSLTNLAFVDAYVHVHLFTLGLFVVTVATFIYLILMLPKQPRPKPFYAS